MAKRLASLILLLFLAGGTVAGIPLHFGEQVCSMHGMMGMDCCKAALLSSQTPEVAAAKLCCALDCAQNGTTSPPNGVRVRPPAPVAVIPHPAVTQSMVNSLLSERLIDRSHGPPGSQPAYLLNLALLI